MKLPVLSHTFLDNYDNCPRKAWHLYVAKDLPREDPTPKMAHGIAVHKGAERALKANDPSLAFAVDLPVGLGAHVGVILASDAIKHFEAVWAITATGSPIGFWDDSAWFRGKVDVALVAPPHAMILDWKIGTVREDPTELERFSLLLRPRYPNVEVFAGAYVWLKGGVGYGETHELNPDRALARIRELADDILTRAVNEEWDPTPNPLCGWCRVKTCEFWRERT